MRRALAAVLFGSITVGCIGGLDPPSIVKTPRILAMVVDRPEARPGQTVEIAAMISVPDEAPRPLALRWSVCLDLGSVVEANGFRAIQVPGRPDCETATLDEQTPFRVEGTRTQTLVDQIEMAAAFAAGDESDAGRLARQIPFILATAGIAYEVGLDVLDADGDVLVSGYKRAAITTRETLTTNPPAPTFRVDDATVVTEERFECGPPITVAPDVEVELEPLLPEGADTEDWLETFPIFDYTGGIIEGHENAYYTWYATAGSFSAETTRPPERLTRWHTPEETGPQTLWLVVRDGHLGTSACRLEVTVAP